MKLFDFFANGPTTIEYLPDKGIKVNSTSLDWGEERKKVREKLNYPYRQDDRVIDLATYFDGDESKNIEVKRDIYENISKGQNSFSLNYDSDDKLKEVEVHNGALIIVQGLQLRFGQAIGEIQEFLQDLDETHQELDAGNHLFSKLKLTIADSESMGGEGNGLSYFYASSDINHLLTL